MMAVIPASIRYNNPGAQYPGQSAQRYGSTGTEVIGGGHKIAVFDDPVKGAAAQFDLLRRGYTGMSLADAINKWSGGNSSGAYAARIARETGLTPDTILSPEMLANPALAVPLARTMASWEAGRPYPMSDEQWTNAHRMALGGPMPTPTGPSGIPQATFDPATGQLGPKPLAMTAPTPDEQAGVAKWANPNIAPTPPLTGSQEGQGMLAGVIPDFNQATGRDVLAGLGGFLNAAVNNIQTPSAPRASVDLPSMAGPRVDLQSVMSVLADRAKRGGYGRV